MRTNVAEIRKNAVAWNKHIVLVEANLGACEGYDCRIFDLPPQANIGSKDTELSIGYTEQFDREAKNLQNKKILLTARINALEILTPGIDRSPQLEPINIVAWYPSAKKLAEGI